MERNEICRTAITPERKKRVGMFQLDTKKEESKTK